MGPSMSVISFMTVTAVTLQHTVVTLTLLFMSKG
jgi:hypothetical protein